MEESSDAALLGLIARAGDRQAFAELFDRYRLRAYNLARHLLRNPAEAEDAVQEAMLAVWTSADRFRYEKNAGGWILKIVAAKCLQTNRKQGRSKRREERMRDMLAESPQTCAGTVEERKESFQALQVQLERLPSLERQLLALYYGADLAQDEISRMLSIPQRTISHKLRGALERLRAELAAAGIGAVASLLSPVGLREALTTGTPVPPGLYERILEGLARASREAGHATSGRAAALRPAAAAWFAIAAALAGGIVWVLLSGTSQEAVTYSAPPGPVPASPKPVPAVAKAPTEPGALQAVNFRWDFEALEGAEGLVALRPGLPLPVQGSWFWERHAEGAGMACSNAILVLPVEIPPQPLRVSVRCQVRKGHPRGVYAADWTDGERSLPCKSWNRGLGIKGGSMQFYFLGRHVFYLSKDEVIAAFEYESEYAANKILLRLDSVRIQEIAVRSLAESEIPPKLRNPDHFLTPAGAAVPARPLKDGGPGSN